MDKWIAQKAQAQYTNLRITRDIRGQQFEYNFLGPFPFLIVLVQLTNSSQDKAGPNGSTPLFVAAKYDRLAAAKLLVGAGQKLPTLLMKTCEALQLNSLGTLGHTQAAVQICI